MQSPVPFDDVCTVWFGGHETVGACVSVTATTNTHDVVPQVFAAVRVTVVVPLLKVAPLPVPLPLPVVAPVNA